MRTDRRLLARALHAFMACGMVAGAMSAGHAQAAGFVSNRAGWTALSPEARIGYVQALNDSLNYTFLDDTLVKALSKRGRTQCLIDKKTNASQLAEIITIAYRSDANANIAPPALYILKMTDICRDYINRERQGFGLGPI